MHSIIRATATGSGFQKQERLPTQVTWSFSNGCSSKPSVDTKHVSRKQQDTDPEIEEIESVCQKEKGGTLIVDFDANDADKG
jgi:hypothetical protein